jgi:hypothetical protein
MVSAVGELCMALSPGWDQLHTTQQEGTGTIQRTLPLGMQFHYPNAYTTRLSPQVSALNQSKRFSALHMVLSAGNCVALPPSVPMLHQ